MDTMEMKTIITIITSTVVYSHYIEALNQGTFQTKMDIIFQKNGLPKVLFPTEINVKGIEDVFQNIAIDEEVDKLMETEDYVEDRNTHRREEEKAYP